MNSRAKGARGEREWAEFLRDRLNCPDARRGCQFAGRSVSGDDTPDVVGGIPLTHPEVKRTERLSLYQAMGQAVNDCGDAIPYVAHKKNREDWVVVVRAIDLLEFCQAVCKHMGEAECQSEGGADPEQSHTSKT